VAPTPYPRLRERIDDREWREPEAPARPEVLLGGRAAHRAGGPLDHAAASRPRRDVGVDAMRGLAVLTMVGANLACYMVDEPYPFWLRVYASLAAPAFIFLAGFLAGLSNVRRPATLGRQLKRMLALLLVASALDVLLWREPPFTSFDVLYVIALLAPASHLALRLPRPFALLVTAVFLLATPALHHVVGYETDSPWGWGRVQALFVDGWFPVFPWLGVGLLGAVLGAYRGETDPARFARRVAALGILLFAAGVVVWWLTSPEHRTTGGYAELFYPPSLGVLFAMLGPELCLLVLLIERARAWPWRALAVYGRAALAMYVAHLAFIAFVVRHWFSHQGLARFALMHLALALGLWLLALAIRRRWPAPRSFWARLMLGS